MKSEMIIGGLGIKFPLNLVKLLVDYILHAADSLVERRL